MIRATFSACGTYRHLLAYHGKHACGWVMLNPSIAGGVDPSTREVIDDPTARRVLGFSKSFGYDAPVIANVYDKVSTDPQGLWIGAPPASAVNSLYLKAVALLPLVIIACGRNVRPDDLARTVALLDCELWCLGVNDDGTPKHPLYLPAETKLQRFNP